MIPLSRLQKLARRHGTPLFVIDHDALRKAYREFRRYLPRVQVYYAVKANPDAEIVRTLFAAGASFDVASMPEFMIVYENIRRLPAKERQQWIWDKMEIAPDFLARKHMLDEVKGLFTAEKYVHIGDRDLDKQFAEMAGFDFLWMHEAESEPWFEWTNGS